MNHLAHRLATPTDVIIPNHFIDSLAGPLDEKELQVPSNRWITWPHSPTPTHAAIYHLNPPKVMVRRLQGDGIHDSEEILSIPEDWLDGLELSYADENQLRGILGI